MKSRNLILNEEDVEVFFTTSDAEPGDNDHPSYSEEHTIYFVEKNGVDILEQLTKEDINQLEEQLSNE